MEFLNNYFAFIDLFQCPITLLFNSKARISTPASKMLSLLIYLVLLGFFLQSDMWNRKNPKISDQMVSNTLTRILLDQSNFQIVLTLQDGNGNFIEFDPSYLSIEVANYFETSDTESTMNISMEPCKNNYFADVKSNNSLCPGCLCMANDSIININMTQNSWVGDYSFLKIVVRMCSNSTSVNNSCRPMEEIWEFVNEKYFSLSFQEYFFDMNNYAHPAKVNYQTTKEAYLIRNFYQYSSLSLMEVQLSEDNNYLYEEEVSLNSYFQQDPSQYFSNFNFRSDEEIIEKNITSLLEFRISPSLNKREIKRKYQKITEVFSLLGGLATFLRHFGGIVANFFYTFSILQTISENNILKGKKKEKVDRKIQLKRQESNYGIINEEKPKINLHISNFSNSVEMLTRHQKDLEMESKSNDSQNRNVTSGSSGKRQKKKPPEIEIFELENIPREKKSTNKRFVFSTITFANYVKYLAFKAFKISYNEKCKNVERIVKDYEEEFDVFFFIKHIWEFKKKLKYAWVEEQKTLINSFNYNP